MSNLKLRICTSIDSLVIILLFYPAFFSPLPKKRRKIIQSEEIFLKNSESVYAWIIQSKKFPTSLSRRTSWAPNESTNSFTFYVYLMMLFMPLNQMFTWVLWLTFLTSVEEMSKGICNEQWIVRLRELTCKSKVYAHFSTELATDESFSSKSSSRSWYSTSDGFD